MRKFVRRACESVSIATLMIALTASGLIAAGAGQKSRSTDENAVADFYKGKTVTILVGFAHREGRGLPISAYVLWRS